MAGRFVGALSGWGSHFPERAILGRKGRAWEKIYRSGNFTLFRSPIGLYFPLGKYHDPDCF